MIILVVADIITTRSGSNSLATTTGRRVADGDAQIRGEAVAEFLRRPGNSRFAIDRLRRRFSNLDPLFR